MKNVTVYKGKKLSQGAILILKHRLNRGVNGLIARRMESILTHTHKSIDKIKLSIYWLEDEPVACVYRYGKRLMSYCKKKYRGNGFASACVCAVTKPHEVMYAQDSPKFWRKQKCRVKINPNYVRY